MMLGRIACVCGLLLIGAATQARADQVDDLLSGRPVTVAEDNVAKPARVVSTSASRDESSSFHNGFVDSDSSPLSQDFEVKLGPHSGGPIHGAKSAPAASLPVPEETRALQLVPEPSAIALAVGAFLYFLIFFRRWKFV